MGFSTEDLPRVGDIIDYTENRKTYYSVPVTGIRHLDGYTDVWFQGAWVDEKYPDRAHFNINHTTGLCNTSHSKGGRWKLIARAQRDQPVESGPATTLDRIRTAVSEAFSDHQYSFDSDEYPWGYAAQALVANPNILPVTFDVPDSWTVSQAENYLRIWADHVGVKVSDLAVLLANEWLEAEGVDRP